MQRLNEYSVSFSRHFFASVCLLPPLLFFGIPNLQPTFWLIILVLGGEMAGTAILFMKAIKLSPLSLTIPMLAFTPLFLLVTSPLLLGEFPSIPGLIGVLLIVFGTYILSITDVQKGYLAPFRALIKEKGSMIMLLVAVIFSLGANLFKIAIQQSSPLFAALLSNFFASLLLFPVFLTKSGGPFKAFDSNLRTLFLTGLFFALLEIFNAFALTITLVTYVISVRRTTIVFSILFGHIFFKEKHIKTRLLGALIMTFGVAAISLF